MGYSGGGSIVVSKDYSEGDDFGSLSQPDILQSTQIKDGVGMFDN